MLPPRTNMLHRKAPLPMRYEAALKKKKKTYKKDFLEEEETLKFKKLLNSLHGH